MSESLLVIGEAAIDIVVRCNLNFEPDSNTFPDDMEIRVGGTGLNFAYAFAKFMKSGYYVCPISKDIFGVQIREFIKENDISGSYPLSEKPSPVVLIFINSQGERSAISRIFGTSYTDISFESIIKSDFEFSNVYISGGILTEEKPQREVLKAAKFFYERGMRIFFDPQFRIGKNINGFYKTAVEIIHYSDFILGNESEIEKIPKNVISERLNRGAVVVCKRGNRGALCIDKDSKYEVEGFKVEPKHVSGAGDVFDAAFVYEVLSNVSTQNSLVFANTIAADFIRSGKLVV